MIVPGDAFEDRQVPVGGVSGWVFANQRLR
jgi:hypothetical protein